MRVLFIAAEATPFAKLGGLADVVFSLARALKGMGLQVAIALPRYLGVEERTSLEEVARYTVPLGEEGKECVVYRGQLPRGDVEVYFLDHPPFFRRPGIYGEGGKEYPDAIARFSFLSWAGGMLPERLGWVPDIIHIHDWHTALVPVLLHYELVDSALRDVKVLLTIHNLAYQGTAPLEQAASTGLPPEATAAITHRGVLNLLYGGIKFAHMVNTVSPSYAQEILERGEGLEEILRVRAERGELVGILNGVDYSLWDPATDPHIWAHYSADDLSGKAINKRRLQEALGLEVTPDVPLVGMISRLVEQKGFDLIIPAFDRMMSLGIQFVVLGTGEPRYEEALRDAASRYPGRVAALITFSEEWAHRIEAASDIFLMPSKFEPCGLNQMYSLRYGAVPVVRATGGLKDTVRECDPGSDSGNGFLFEEYTPEAMLAALKRAVDLYRNDRDAWRRLMVRGMREDHSWEASAREYVELYRRLKG